MIITCNNCNKKFDIDSSLISDKGRLLQCASCDHKWFFKKVVPENPVSSIDEDIANDNANIFEQNNSPIIDVESVSDASNDEVEVNLEEKNKEKIKINKGENKQVNTQQKNKKILKY
ncbi:zinc-ribbon domain-containing protein [Candidatus Pelagibacter ubique]|nr:zinc-ribbon domain-containing protein [Candidatus Pelagibacter ubique]